MITLHLYNNLLSSYSLENYILGYIEFIRQKVEKI